MRWGILSTARINAAFVPGARAAGGEVAALASRDPERARQSARELDIPRVHASYEALLADPAIDAVYVPLPNSLHVEWTLAALRAGKHVLCEKPLGRDPEAVTAAFDEAERRGLVLMEAFMYRHHPQTLRLAELVAGGAIGELRSVHASFSFVLTRTVDVRLSAALQGGALMDVGCYGVNAARMLAGQEPQHVLGAQVTGGDGVDLDFAATLEFPNQVLAQIDASIRSAPRSALEVVGSGGSLFLSDPWHCARPGIEHRTATGIERVPIPPADPYQLQAENFAAAVAGQAPALLDRGDAVGQARVLAALTEAARTTGMRVLA